ncbi:hypothetical protein JXB31_03175 [Candidatus Woesearchaeota archaeon]|nr:hypothetical protein [Candidatus Woesearchaeota archaeon]
MEEDSAKKIICKAILQMMGSPKKHIEDTIKQYVKKIKEDYKEISVVNEFYSKAKKEKDSPMYNVFAELDMEVQGIENLVWFCIDYMPASIEISDPDEIVYSAQYLTGFVNDLLAKLHKVDMRLKHLSAENQVLGKNGVTLMKNIIIVQLKNGPKGPDELAEGAGVPVEHINKFLAVMEKEGKITKDGKKYKIDA